MNDCVYNVLSRGEMWPSPAGVHHHDEFVSLGAVSDGELDLAQGELAGGRAAVNTEAAGVTPRACSSRFIQRG